MLIGFVFLISFWNIAAGFPHNSSEVVANIKDHVSLYKTLSSESLCTENACCNISSPDSCDIALLPKGQSTLVLPGMDTRCIFSYSTPFAFQVIPGRSDKVVFYFQGGGACWDQTSTEAGTYCTTDSSPQSPVGIFDPNNSDNKYKDYTIIHALYCSGDVWMGDTVREYNDDAGVPVQQVGLKNAQTVLDWAVRQQLTGGLESELADLVVMGCSAGSVGAQIWGGKIIAAMKSKTASVVPDSYAGYFPTGTESSLINQYGFCKSDFMSSSLTEKCCNNTVTFREIMTEQMQNSPETIYAYMQSKVDNIQMSFYMSVGMTAGVDYLITPAEFYSGVNDIFALYNKEPNFVTYMIDGSQHCFTPYNNYYTANADGAEDSVYDGLSLNDWASAYPLSNGDVVNTICDGEITSSPIKHEIDYCDAEVVPKSFTEEY